MPETQLVGQADDHGAATNAEKARHTEIARRYAWDGRRRGEKRPPFNRIANKRLRELEKLFHDRYGFELPDDHAGRDDLMIAMHHIARVSHNPDHAMRKWTELRAPWCVGDELADMIANAIASPKTYKADELAGLLGLTYSDRERLGINTIGSIDVNKAGRAKIRKQKDRDRKTAKRRADGVKPRQKPPAVPAWELLKMSKRTWYRKGKPQPPKRKNGTSGTPKSAVDKDNRRGLSNVLDWSSHPETRLVQNTSIAQPLKKAA